MKILILSVVVFAAASVSGQSSNVTHETASSAGTVLSAIESELTRISPEAGRARLDPEAPLPPQLPRDFKWEGRYIVRDLNVDVHFTWNGRDGNSQMIAGSWEEPIYFTNIIYNGQLYTLTYKWPTPIPGPGECTKVGSFSREALNLYLLLASRYVGPEILIETEYRYVNHFRVGVVLDLTPPRPPYFPIRFPIAAGDFYVDQADSSKFWKVLHFGLQNLYDPALDEWIVLDRFENRPGSVRLPVQCWGR
jgi:hypothetical protein